MSARAFRLIQISDFHLFENVSTKFKGINTDHTLKRVIELIKHKEPNLDAIIMTGDLAEDGSVTVYERIVDYMKDFTCCVYFIPGNHDNIELMYKHLKRFNIKQDKQIKLGDWNILLLDSVIPGKIAGSLSQHEQDFLEYHLKDDGYKLIALHHNPYTVRTTIFEPYGLQNAQKFWEIVKKHPNIKLVVCGHVHHDFHAFIHNTTFLTCPSTWIQVEHAASLNVYNKTVFDKQAPGYRWIQLNPDGSFETGIRRISPYEDWVYYE